MPPDPSTLPVLPELPDYPSPGQIGGVIMNAVFLDSLDFDALQMSRINRLIEGAVRRVPEQYFWQHRRFKSRPPGEPPIYRR
jgi:lauroyl/myristoyl acyltransferase